MILMLRLSLVGTSCSLRTNRWKVEVNGCIQGRNSITLIIWRVGVTTRDERTEIAIEVHRSIAVRSAPRCIAAPWVHPPGERPHRPLQKRAHNVRIVLSRARDRGTFFPSIHRPVGHNSHFSAITFKQKSESPFLDATEYRSIRF